MTIAGLVLLVLGLGIGLVALRLAVFTVEQQTVAIIERFGKYLRTADPGIGFKIPFVDFIHERPSFRVTQLAVEVETKTKDDAFVDVTVAVQYRVMKDKVLDAVYQLEDVEQQIKSYVSDVIRARVPTLTFEQLFESTEDLAKAVADQLDEKMATYGYNIVTALVTEIDPDEKIKAAKNEVQAKAALRLAALAQGEAEKTLAIARAEAEAASKKLQGEGIAAQRRAIIEGFQAAVTEMASATKIDTEEVLNLVLLTQFFDTLQAIGAHKGTTIMVPFTPGGLGDLKQQLQQALLPIVKVHAEPAEPLNVRAG